MYYYKNNKDTVVYNILIITENVIKDELFVIAELQLKI